MTEHGRLGKTPGRPFRIRTPPPLFRVAQAVLSSKLHGWRKPQAEVVFIRPARNTTPPRRIGFFFFRDKRYEKRTGWRITAVCGRVR